MQPPSICLSAILHLPLSLGHPQRTTVSLSPSTTTVSQPPSTYHYLSATLHLSFSHPPLVIQPPSTCHSATLHLSFSHPPLVIQPPSTCHSATLHLSFSHPPLVIQPPSTCHSATLHLSLSLRWQSKGSGNLKDLSQKGSAGSEEAANIGSVHIKVCVCVCVCVCGGGGGQLYTAVTHSISRPVL